MSQSIYEIPVKDIKREDTTLAVYQGKVLLIVNTASKCGLTPQYEGLEKLYQAKKDQGLEILGFPANNFNGQEPGNEEEISSFCSLNYDVHFPLFAKVSVLGADQHPLYSKLTSEQPETTGDGPMLDKLKGFGIQHTDAPDVLWNFEKFLINKEGKVVERFSSKITPDDKNLTSKIDALL
jgi:glutathione peroxidase